MVKKIMIRVGILLLIFFAAVFVFGRIINRGKPDSTQEMGEPSLPLVYVLEEETQMNSLHGHVKEMDVMAMRDALTPISSERTLTIQIQPFQRQVSGVSFEVLTSDGKTSMENTKVTKIKEGEKYVTATLELQNKILINTEYMLKIVITSGNRDIYYYTRIIRQDGLNAKAYIDFATDFYQNCLEGNDLNIEEFVEPDPEADNSTFAHVNIHSSTSQMIWKGISPKLYYAPVPNICELNENTGTVVLDYMISAVDEDNRTELYRVSEYYRMRYTDSRILLLDFERDTSEVFDPEASILSEKGIILGITGRDVTYKNDLKNNFFAFVREGTLWSYDVSGNKLVQVFSFAQEGKLDSRSMYNRNDIQVVNIDEQGNMYFLVCGYMNRGIHEGESGVAVYYYDAGSSVVTECLFVDTNQAFSLLKRDVKSLAYVMKDRNGFYLLVNEEAYFVNMESRQVDKVISGLAYGCYGASASGRQFGWMDGKDPYDASAITVMDLETHAMRKITCGEGQRLKFLGFIGEDLTYGLADTEKIDLSHEGSEIFPMHQILIVNEAGQTVKDYAPKDCYVSEAEIKDGLMTLKRIRKSGSGYQEAPEDQIVGSAASEETSFGLTTAVSERKKEIHILKVGTALKAAEPPRLIKCRQQIFEGSKEIILEPKKKSEDLYYVYAKGYLDGIYTSANQAIRRADEMLGVVVDGKQRMVWERGNKQTKLDLNVKTFPEVFREYKLDAAVIQSEMSQRVLDLTGCTLEQVLYFVSAGTPVLAKTPGGVVIIGGYDEYNTRLLEKGDEELTYAGLQDSKDMFEEAGNVFITYLDPITE